MKFTKEERIKLTKALQSKVPEFALKVAHLYQLLEWKWTTGVKDEYEIPGVIELRKALYNLIIGLNKAESSDYTSGGLGVRIFKNDDNSIDGWLYFEYNEICIPEE